jgi:hypothetical protein
MPIHIFDAIIFPAHRQYEFKISFPDKCEFVLYVHVNILNN